MKQAGRQWLALLCRTLVDKFGMEQYRANPYVFWKTENIEIIFFLAVHAHDLLVSGNETECEKLLGVINGQLSTRSLEELERCLGCAMARDWEKNTIKINQPAMVDALLTARFDVKHSFNISTSPVA